LIDSLLDGWLFLFTSHPHNSGNTSFVKLLESQIDEGWITQTSKQKKKFENKKGLRNYFVINFTNLILRLVYFSFKNFKISNKNMMLYPIWKTIIRHYPVTKFYLTKKG